MPNGNHLRVVFDNINIDVDQSGLTRPACLLDVGNRWGAGPSYGSTGEGLQIDGNITTTMSVENDDSVYDRRAVNSPSSTYRFSDRDMDAHVSFCAHGMTYTDAGNLKVRSTQTDGTDTVCFFDETWGSKLPECEVFGYGDGVGVQYGGVINAEQKNYALRNLDYGIVAGSPKYGGDSVYYADCAEESDGIDNDSANGIDDAAECDETAWGVRGVTFYGGVVEGNQFANFIDFGLDRRNIFRDYHEEAGTGVQIANKVIKPFVCDAPTATMFEARRYTPVGDDEAIDCLERLPINHFIDGTGACLIGSDTINFATYDGGVAATGDDAYIRGTFDAALDGITHNIAAVIAGTGTGTGISVDTDCTTIATTHERAWVSIINLGTNLGTASAIGGTNEDGTTVFSGRLSGAGAGANAGTGYDAIGTPAIMIGEGFTDPNRIMFTDGILASGASGSRYASTRELFTFAPELTRAGRTGWDYGDSLAATVGQIDTSGMYLNGTTMPTFPTTYDDWFDSREQSFMEFIHKDSTGAGVRSDNASKSSNECVYGSSRWNISNVLSCAEATLVSPWTARVNPFYLTRAHWSVTSTVSGDEGCGIGIGVTGVSGTHAKQLFMPDQTGTPGQMAAGEGIMYGINAVVDNTGTGVPNYFFAELFRGDFSQNAGTVNCEASAVYGAVEVRGFPFLPFQ